MTNRFQYLLLVALLVGIALGMGQVAQGLTAGQHLAVITDFEVEKYANNMEKYFVDNIRKLGAVSEDMGGQVQAIKDQARQARDHMREWTNNAVAKDKDQVMQYVIEMSHGAEELANAERDFVGLCDTCQELLFTLGEELKADIASVEATKTAESLEDAQELMRSTVDMVYEELQKIKDRLDTAKNTFAGLADTSRKFANDIEDDIETLKSQFRSGPVYYAFVAALSTCGVSGGACVVVAGVLCPTLLLCGGGGGMITMFESSAKRLKMQQENFRDLEMRCDGLHNKAEEDAQQLTELESRVRSEKLIMGVKSIHFWKTVVLPKNDAVVKKMQDIVGHYHNS